MSNIDIYVSHALNTRFSDLPADVVEKTKVFLFDSLGVGIAGAGAALAGPIRACVRDWGGGAGAHVWGQDAFETSAANAAFINAYQIHCQEFDCVHERAVAHPMAVILAALLAESESSVQTVSGQDLAVAIAVAVDLAAGLGVAATSPVRFFRPANVGLFGAVLALSRLRGFDAEQTKSALGHALGFCSGTMQAHIEGMPTLALQVANGARSAIMAVDLTSAGIPGAKDSLEGPYGYLRLFEEVSDLTPVAATVGQVWRIAEVSHKPFPTGRAAHGGIVLLQQLLEQGLDVSQLKSLKLIAPPLIHRLVGRPIQSDMSVSYARLCFQYVGAVALTKGTVGLDDYTSAALTDAGIQELGAKISVVDDGSADPAAFAPQTAEAVLTDGRTMRADISALYGAPSSPMLRDAQVVKFRSCLQFGFGHPSGELADTLCDLIDNLNTLHDTTQLSRLAAGKDLHG
jgi:2-methylcitrate dehydratase PrpD